MKIHAGTSGFSYKEWRGTFYPEKIKAEEMLATYAQTLNAVEINNTFYRMPRSNVMKQWFETVPDDFRFSIKASRRITHQQRLKDCEESSQYLAERLAHLQHKLATVLFQLPPFLRKDTERLGAFLKTWPKELPASFEFRHESWFDNEVYDLLAEHNAALVASEAEDLTTPDRLLTASWVYLRLRKPGYSPQALSGWLRKANNTGTDQLYAFFKHEEAGAGPKLAAQFLRMGSKLETAAKPKRAAPKKKPAANQRRA